MKRELRIKALLLILLGIPFGLFAKEINYGSFITYDGKVNKSLEPEGKGKLVTQYNVLREYNDGSITNEEQKDILKGKFFQGKVTDAEVQFARYNGPLWLNHAVFKGTLEYTLLEGDKGIKYTLLEGVFVCNNYTDFSISPNNPFVITRVPSENGCETIAEPLSYASVSNQTQSNNRIHLLIGEVKEYLNIREYRLNKEWNFEKTREYLKPVYADGTEIITNSENDDFSVRYKNGDYFNVFSNGDFELRKTYNDATLTIGDETQIAYNDGSTYSGTISTERFYSSEDAYEYYMKPTSMAEIGFDFYTGEFVKNGEVIKYIEGRTEAEILAEQERLRKAKEEEERRLKEEEEVRMRLRVQESVDQVETIRNVCVQSRNGKDIIKKTVHLINLEGNSTSLETTDQGLLENSFVIKTYDFGVEGKTIAMYGYIAGLGLPMSYSISGKDVVLLNQSNNGKKQYVAADDKGRIAFILSELDNGKWGTFLVRQSKKMISDVYEGMTLLELENCLRPLGAGRLKLISDDGELKVIQFLWLDMQKNYYWFGEDDYNYELTNDKEYGRFYFRNNRLEKWIIH